MLPLDTTPYEKAWRVSNTAVVSGLDSLSGSYNGGFDTTVGRTRTRPQSGRALPSTPTTLFAWETPTSFLSSLPEA